MMALEEKSEDRQCHWVHRLGTMNVCLFEQRFIAIHAIVVEIFHSGPNRHAACMAKNVLRPELKKITIVSLWNCYHLSCGGIPYRGQHLIRQVIHFCMLQDLIWIFKSKKCVGKKFLMLSCRMVHSFDFKGFGLLRLHQWIIRLYKEWASKALRLRPIGYNKANLIKQLLW